MKNLIIIALSILFVSACTSTETKVEMAIEKYYQNISLQSGAGNHSITDIEILRFENDTAIAVVSGYYKNKSTSKVESSNMQDTLLFLINKTNHGFHVKGIRAF